MSWERFQYLCRVLAAGQSTNTAAGVDYYGPPPPSGSLPHELLATLEARPEAERVALATLYGRLALHDVVVMPPRLRRIVGYLGLLALVYYGLAAIYYLRVLPSFANAFDHLGAEPPALMNGMQYYWYLPLWLVAILLAVAIVASLQVKWLYRFSSSRGKTFLLPVSLRRHQHAVEALLRFPLEGSDAGEGAYTHRLIVHLQTLKVSGLSVGAELEALLRVEGGNMYRQTSRYMQILTALVGLVLIASIFLFLASAYAPIFVLGEVI